MPWSTWVIILIRFTPMQLHWGCSHCPCQGCVFLAHIWGDTELAQAFPTQAKLLHANKTFTPHHPALGNIYLYSLCGNSKVFFFKRQKYVINDIPSNTHRLYISAPSALQSSYNLSSYILLWNLWVYAYQNCVCVDCYHQGGLGEKKQIRCSNLITGYNKSQDFFELILI